MFGHSQLRTCCRMLLGCIEALPVECRDTRRHRLALSGVSESERHPRYIGNGNFKLGQYPTAELVSDISPTVAFARHHGLRSRDEAGVERSQFPKCFCASM